MYETFVILKQVGGQLPSREVMEQIQRNITFTPWETACQCETDQKRRGTR